jgi:DNA-binding transcriptional LysR family regulator
MSDPRSDRFVRSHLKTRHLVLLVELGRHRSILHAAQAANLTQPAASKLLGEIEHALNVQLFERLPRGVVPTRYGEVLIRRAGTALAEMDAAHQEVMELFSGLAGRVAIGSVLTPSASLVPAAVKLLKSHSAKLQVSITVDTSNILVERLRAGEFDLVIGRLLDTSLASEFNFEPLTDEPHCLIAAADHPFVGRQDLQLADLAREPWVLPPAGSMLRNRLSAMFLAQGLEPPVDVVETMSMPTVVNLLPGSRMIAAMPEETVRPYLDAGLLAVLPWELGLRMDVYGIITRRRHRLSPGAESMLQALRDTVQARYRR